MIKDTVLFSSIYLIKNRCSFITTRGNFVVITQKNMVKKSKHTDARRYQNTKDSRMRNKEQ